MPTQNVFLKGVNYYQREHTIKYQEYISNSIGAKSVCIDDRFTLPSIISKGKDCINKFITWYYINKNGLNK